MHEQSFSIGVLAATVTQLSRAFRSIRAGLQGSSTKGAAEAVVQRSLPFHDHAMPLDPPARAASTLGEDRSAATLLFGSVRVILFAITLEGRYLKPHDLNRGEAGIVGGSDAPDGPIRHIQEESEHEKAEQTSAAPETNLLPT